MTLQILRLPMNILIPEIAFLAIMNPYKTVPKCTEEAPFLPRTTSSPNFAEILRKHRCTRSRQSCNRTSIPNTRRSESNGSENSQVLYMADHKRKKARRTNRSLSFAGNGNASFRQAGVSISEVANGGGMDEEISWDIIDREIFEWQFVCQTGRPYWWSPELKHARKKRVSPRLGYASYPKIWTRDVNPLRLKSEYAARRRAASDNYLANPSAVHDLAHLVAVQLLSSCFTLPPEQPMGFPTYASKDSSLSALRDPPMISSLRMHTHFRYSPSFGHQAQNTSPVHLWPRTFDGPPPVPSTLDNPDTKIQKRRFLDTTEDTHGSSDDENEIALRRYCKSVLSSDFGIVDQHKRQSEADYWSRSKERPALPKIQGSVGKQPKRCSTPTRRLFSESAQIEDSEDFDSRSNSPNGTLRSNYRLQAVIRSEPHHVFVQPVRELVVKRWRNLRRRLSSSLHSSLPARASRERISASECHSSGESSTTMSSDGKARRRRARERGYIESSRFESTQCYNSPVSGRNTPASGKSIPLPRPSPTSPSWFPVLANTEANQNSLPASPSLATWGSNHSRQGLALQPTGSSLISTPSPNSSGRNTERRRSMLSEVFPPMDVARNRRERNMLSAAGSALSTPTEDYLIGFGSRQPLIAEILNYPISDSALAIIELGKTRPSIMRTSTSGTQVFTPSEDGVELDGLPVGPSRDHWVGKGDRRERTYLF